MKVISTPFKALLRFRQISLQILAQICAIVNLQKKLRHESVKEEWKIVSLKLR